MPEQRAALDGATAGDRFRIRELAPRSIIQISAFHGRADAAAEALGRDLGTRLPATAGAVAEGDGFAILCVGPGRWWLVGERRVPPDLDPALAAVVDQSHGRVVLEVRGDRVRELLTKGTSLDLHPRSLPVGACAATGLGHFAVVLHVRAGDRFEVHVARSYARPLFEWLEDAALEFESGVVA